MYYEMVLVSFEYEMACLEVVDLPRALLSHGSSLMVLGTLGLTSFSALPLGRDGWH